MRRAAALLPVLVAVLARGGAADEPPPPPRPPPPPTDDISKAAGAPAASDDISKDGACKDAVAQHCTNVAEGNGEVFHCLRDAVKAERWTKAQEEGSVISKLCKREVRQFSVKVMGRDAPATGPGSPRDFWLEPVKGLRKACKEDIKSFCPKAHGPNLTACLKAHKAELSEPCSSKVFEVQEMQAEDMEFDNFFYEACKTDLSSIEQCAKVRAPLRKACLASPKYRDQLSDKCKEALFKRDVEESEDIRLSPDALKDCEEAIATVCKDVPFGEARMLECLWNKVVTDEEETGTYDKCSKKVLEMVGRQVSHYKLDFGVRTKCVEDVQQHCSAEKEQVDRLPIGKAIGPDSKGGQVIQCLERNLRSLKPECHKEISRVVRIQAQRADLAPEIRTSCKSELTEFCKDVLPSDKHTCLRSHFKDLGQDCRTAEMRQSKVEMDTFVLRPKTGQVCKFTADKFCPGMVWGEKLNCLQDHMYQESFATGCRHAITADLEANNHDWQLKYGVTSQCQEDVRTHCNEILNTPGAPVLDCLGQAHTAGTLIQDGCKMEIGRYLKGGAENIKVLPEAYRACQEDVAQFCRKTPAGRGRVHTCLVHHKEDLSQECAVAEFKNQAAQSNDIRMNPEAEEHCGPVMEKLCPGVEPGGGRMWACLFKQRAHPDMPRECVEVLRDRNKLKHKEFFLNPSLAKHCSAEAERLCPEQMQKASRKDFESNGGVISCLIARRKEIEDPECGQAVGRKQAERVADADLDPDHEAACSNDIERFCSEAKKSALHSRGTSGVVHKCLQEHIDQLSDDCAAKEKVYMVAASEDTRLSLDVDQHCKQARQRWCEGTPDEEGLVTMCLMQHMHDDSMESSCRTALEGEQKKAASSLRFNPQLRKMCSSELSRLRKEGKCSKKSKKGQWIDCITDNAEDIHDPDCRGEVLKVMQLHSADLRAKPGMKDACKEDIDRLCGAVPPGAGRLHQCLREKIAQVQNEECKTMVLTVQKADNKSAVLNFATRKHCKQEVKRFCSDVQSGESRVMTCLGLHMNETGFGERCRHAITNNVNIKSLVKTSLLRGANGVVEKKMDEIKAWIENHRSFAEEHGRLLLSGTIGFVALLTAWISWCILKGCVFSKSGYAPVLPRDSPKSKEAEGVQLTRRKAKGALGS